MLLIRLINGEVRVSLCDFLNFVLSVQSDCGSLLTKYDVPLYIIISVLFQVSSLLNSQS